MICLILEARAEIQEYFRSVLKSLSDLTDLFQQLFSPQLEINDVMYQPTAKKILKKWSEPGTVMGILAAGKEKIKACWLYVN